MRAAAADRGDRPRARARRRGVRAHRSPRIAAVDRLASLVMFAAEWPSAGRSPASTCWRRTATSARCRAAGGRWRSTRSASSASLPLTFVPFARAVRAGRLRPRVRGERRGLRAATSARCSLYGAAVARAARPRPRHDGDRAVLVLPLWAASSLRRVEGHLRRRGDRRQRRPPIGHAVGQRARSRVAAESHPLPRVSTSTAGRRARAAARAGTTRPPRRPRRRRPAPAPRRVPSRAVAHPAGDARGARRVDHRVAEADALHAAADRRAGARSSRPSRRRIAAHRRSSAATVLASVISPRSTPRAARRRSS